MPSVTINWAEYAGYESLAAAIVFAAVYFPLNLWFTMRALTHLTYVRVVLALFCAIRVAAFVIRAVMIKVESAAENRDLFLADQVLFGIGYAGLLYSAYTLVLDLAEQASSRHRTGEHPAFRLLRDRRLFRLAVAVAVTLSIVASTTLKADGTSGSKTTTLREASTIIFLALTGLLFLQTCHLAKFNLSESRGSTSFGAVHGAKILMVVTVFLLIREVFVTVTMTPSRHASQMKEKFWYPLLALPEFLAVVLFLTPGLVPSRKELQQTIAENKKQPEY